MQENYPQNVHLLSIQYRMHPMISIFPSKQFYDAELEDGEGMKELRTELWHNSRLFGPYRFFHVLGRESQGGRTSLVNMMEIETAVMLFQRLTADFPEVDFDGKVGIITPYKQQLTEMKRRFQRAYGERIIDTIDFNTTDAFQGRERDIIIFSCVRASPEGGIGFLSDIRRMNVGLTRAKSSLYILGNAVSLTRNKLWGSLVHDARARGLLTDVNKQLFSQSTRGKGSVKQSSGKGSGGASNQAPLPVRNFAPTAPVVRTTGSDPMDIDGPQPPPGSRALSQLQADSRSGEPHNPQVCPTCGKPGHRQTECPQTRGNPSTHAQHPRPGKGYGGSRLVASTHDVRIPTIKTTSTGAPKPIHAPKRQHSYDGNVNEGNKRPHFASSSTTTASGPDPGLGPSLDPAPDQVSL